jgi:hypothetical protein
MNWIKQNTFLTGFFAAMLIGIGGLGYFLISAKGAAEEAKSAYSQTSGELTNLQGQKISRNQQNLTKLNTQRDKAVQVTKEFQSLLTKMSFPIEAMTPEQFQDRLRKARTALIERGGGTTTFPKDKFYVGFEEYENQPPIKEAVPALGRELKAIEWLCNDLIDAKVAEISSIKRDKLPEESGKPAVPATGGGAPNRGGGPGGGGQNRRDDSRALMTKSGVDLEFRCTQQALAIFLNSLVDPKVPQFYIIRNLTVKNEKDKGPEKFVAAGAPGLPAANDVKVNAGFPLGQEQVLVSMRIEIVDFSEPATPATSN